MDMDMDMVWIWEQRVGTGTIRAPPRAGQGQRELGSGRAGGGPKFDAGSLRVRPTGNEGSTARERGREGERTRRTLVTWQ
jgi:hypothetical protein